MTALSVRPLSVRLQVAYMATAAIGFANVSAGNTWTRFKTEFANGYNSVNHDHPYTEMWISIQKWYKQQGFNNFCDQEIGERFNAALSIGFTPKGANTVPATSVHTAVKQWDKQGWRRYEHQHAGRVRMAKKVGLIGLVVFGVPVVGDL